jgi:enoyl-CoA hydratase
MTVQLEFRNDFAFITLDRPEALNALNFQTLKDLGSTLDRIEESSARAIFFRGSGEKAFCAGADISELRGRTAIQELDGSLLGQTVFNRIETFKIPSLALIQGYALGGGCELALACTFRIASEKARFGLPEVKLGLVPGYGGTQRLARLIGPSKALEIMMTGRLVDAHEAFSIGLVNRVVSDDLLDASIEFAQSFSKFSLTTIRLIRDAVRRGMDSSLHQGLRIEADLSTISYRSFDGQEGLSAFSEKRKAVFKDK